MFARLFSFLLRQNLIISQVGLRLTILLPQPPKHRDYSYASPWLVKGFDDFYSYCCGC